MTTTLTLPDTDRERSLDERIADACGHLNACHAALVDLVAEVIATDAWHGWGIRSLEHWITWRTGLSGGHARSLIALATAAQSHPKVCAAFAAGQLSIDQAALAVRARREHDDDIAVWARVMTLPQLRVAVRASNTSAADRDNTADDSDPEPTEPDVKPAPPATRVRVVATRRGRHLAPAGSLDADHGASSTPPSAKPATACSATATATSPPPTPSSTSPNAPSTPPPPRSGASGTASTCSSTPPNHRP